MIFSQELHYCSLCRDFVPYVSAIRGASCSECGREFSDADHRAYLRHRRWGLSERDLSEIRPALPVGQQLTVGRAT